MSWETVEPVRIFPFSSAPDRPQEKLLPVFDHCTSKKKRTNWESPKESDENDQRFRKHEERLQAIGLFSLQKIRQKRQITVVKYVRGSYKKILSFPCSWQI